VLNSHCDITGYAEIGDRNFFGTHASMLPHSKVGSGCRIGAGSVVYKKIKDNILAVGNPAIKIYDL
jgi:acetyltransferase-like isoleucine patch superfamily enzyme